MNRIALGAFIALFLAGLGMFWWQGRAEVEEGAPPPLPAPEVVDLEILPQSDAGDLKGPTPPQATELTKEEQRFFRYDRNRDWRVSRNEMLSTRTAAFMALDTNGNNLLEFEEWAVNTVNKFEKADMDKNGDLSPREFLTTKPKPVKKRSCAC